MEAAAMARAVVMETWAAALAAEPAVMEPVVMAVEVEAGAEAEADVEAEVDVEAAVETATHRRPT